MSSIGVIILTKNNVPLFKECIESFVRLCKIKDLSFYVCDTGSNKINLKRYEEYLNKVPYKCELICFEYYNFASINNYIINERLNEDIILFCNDDIYLKNDAVSIMLPHLTEDTGVVGCKLLYPDERIQHGGHVHNCYYKFTVPTYKGIITKCRKVEVERGHIIDRDSLHIIDVTHRNLGDEDKELEDDLDCNGVTFAFSIVNKNVYKNLGGLDTEYKLCYEDMDFCLKSIENGLKNKFIGSAVCYHHESYTRKIVQDNLYDDDDVERRKQRFISFYNKYENKQ